MLVEQLRECFKGAQDADAGDGCDEDMAGGGDTQGVSLIDCISQRFVDIWGICGILLDRDAADAYFI